MVISDSRSHSNNLNSSSKCNAFSNKWDEVIVKELVGGLISAGFSRTIIEEVDGLIHLLPGDLPEIGLLGEELSQKSIGVFIDASLPRGIGMGKIGRGLKGASNPFMLHKF